MGTTAAQNVSYWIDSTEQTSYPSLQQTRADVVVVGAGITGLTAAYLLACDGLRVVVVEAGRVCAGATGFTTGKVTSQHHLIYAKMVRRNGVDRAAAYADAQQAAIERIAAIAEKEEIDCDVRRAPSFVYTDEPARVRDLEAELEAAHHFGLPAAIVEGDIGLPWNVTAALRFDNQLLFHPRKYCLGLAAAIVRRGGSIAEETRAVDVRQGDDCVVKTTRGDIHGDFVVVATQAPFLDRGVFFARMKPVRSYAIAAPWDDPPDGMYISAEQPTRSVRPHFGSDRTILIVGGGGHPTGRREDTEGEYADLDRWAADRFGMAPEWRWSAQDFIAADGAPFIGRITSGSKRIFVATGFAKWGMTNGTVAGMLITDAIAGRENSWRDAFDSTRIDAAKSARIVMSQGLETARSWVGDRLTMLSSREVESLEAGNGAVVRNGGQSIAVFRDDEGRLSAVSARCTHLGCIVHFNKAERTWDCPCHGSRFGTDGRVIDGPATKDLKRLPADETVALEHGRT
ncbi:MAG: FAD-dependent oxidoreductase [Actinomycetota bacterium]|nr:FAD-dependent oxidoreductase [Actinomycetota bacterium]